MQQPDDTVGHGTYQHSQAKQPFCCRRLINRKISDKKPRLTIHRKQILIAVPCRIQQPDRVKRILGFAAPELNIAVFHINDSKNPCGAGKDRHENIGFGNIGYDTLREIIYMKDFENVPKILETPYVKDPENSKKSYAPYGYEIAMIKEGKFNPNLQNIILENNK